MEHDVHIQSGTPYGRISSSLQSKIWLLIIVGIVGGIFFSVNLFLQSRVDTPQNPVQDAPVSS